jgi:aminopeptidase-like protein
LPVCSVMNSKYGTFPEYHTSLDDLEFVTPRGLTAALTTHRRILRILERNCAPKTLVLGEPQLGRRGLYSNLSKVGSATSAMPMRNLIAYADGTQDLIALCDTLDEPFETLADLADMLADAGLFSLTGNPD